MDEHTTTNDTPNSGRVPRAETWKTGVADTLKFVALAAIIIIPIRLYVAQPFIVSGDSMVGSFASGEYLIVDELSYRTGNPKRGDVVIFRYPLDKKQFFIKRIIGLPGETVRVENGSVAITSPNEERAMTIHEPYLSSVRTDEYVEKTLGAAEYFVMGDNRRASSDSRMWGPVPRDLIIGRAFLRLFPVASAGILPGQFDADTL